MKDVEKGLKKFIVIGIISILTVEFCKIYSIENIYMVIACVIWSALAALVLTLR